VSDNTLGPPYRAQRAIDFQLERGDEIVAFPCSMAENIANRPISIPFSGNALACILAFWAGASGFATAASSVGNFSAAANDRFANNPAFVGSGFDFSGVGRDANGKWGVMLSPTVFISANHAAPGGSLVFYPGNNPAATPVTISISSGQALGGSDLYIGRLSSPIPSSITSYSYFNIPLTEAGFYSSAVANLPAFIGGISVSGNAYGGPVTNQVIGTNRIEAFLEDVTANGAGGVSDVLVTVANQPGDTVFGYNPTYYEAQLNGGDSGSPLLVLSGSQLVVAGTALGVGTGDIDPGAGVATREFSAYTYTGSYAWLIQNYIAISAVPEPAVSILPAIFAFAMIHRERRRKSPWAGGVDCA